MNQFKSTFTYKLIYVFGIDDKAHKDLLKIGEATILTDKKPDELLPSSRELNLAAKARIDQYTKTAAIDYTLLYTELAVFEKVIDGKKKLLAFSDKDVHSVLTRSGIARHVFKDENKGVEWFPVDLETAKKSNKGSQRRTRVSRSKRNNRRKNADSFPSRTEKGYSGDRCSFQEK